MGDARLEAWLRSEGLIADHMPIRDQVEYKYAIAVEGDNAPDRLYWQLFFGSVGLVPAGPWDVPWLDMMKPWWHYVPVRYDLSDLVEKLTWLEQHDDEARR